MGVIPLVLYISIKEKIYVTKEKIFALKINNLHTCPTKITQI